MSFPPPMNPYGYPPYYPPGMVPPPIYPPGTIIHPPPHGPIIYPINPMPVPGAYPPQPIIYPTAPFLPTPNYPNYPNYPFYTNHFKFKHGVPSFKKWKY